MDDDDDNDDEDWEDEYLADDAEVYVRMDTKIIFLFFVSCFLIKFLNKMFPFILLKGWGWR